MSAAAGIFVFVQRGGKMGREIVSRWDRDLGLWFAKAMGEEVGMAWDWVSTELVRGSENASTNRLRVWDLMRLNGSSNAALCCRG
jgi:hypothetical protein